MSVQPGGRDILRTLRSHHGGTDPAIQKVLLYFGVHVSLSLVLELLTSTSGPQNAAFIQL